MKYILTLLILGSFVQIANAQLSFKIEELSLSNYNIELKENIINEDLTSGPYVYFKCIITNNSEDTVILRPSNSITNIVFSYKKKSYKIEVEPLPFVDNEKLQLSPKKTAALDFGSNLLLGTDIFNYKKGNYIEEMLAILPTIGVIYKDNNIKLRTDEIKNVELR
ncbi:MAG: hypothetical protein EOM36_00675 [Bacteroidia bacterium]|nr:hypothetical protein [Bacteroidia bacterium]